MSQKNPPQKYIAFDPETKTYGLWEGSGRYFAGMESKVKTKDYATREDAISDIQAQAGECWIFEFRDVDKTYRYYYSRCITKQPK